MTKHSIRPAVLAALIFSAQLGAQEVPRPAAPPKTQVCAVCHGAQGRSATDDVPNLAGQQRAYLAKQLLAFRSGNRKAPVMQAVAVQLSEEDIRDLATYWSKLPAAGAHDGAPVETADTSLRSAMDLPAGFPTGFDAYDREQDEATRIVTVRYANAVALDAARDGSQLPPGSILMSVGYRAVAGADGQPMKDAQGHWQLGAVRSIAGMETRPGWGGHVPAMLRNNDWNYGLWGPGGEPWLRASHAQCLACHKPQAAKQYVFTLEALQRAARR